jgi:Nif-specific regulatory protein
MTNKKNDSLDILYTISQILVARFGEHETLKEILHILSGSCGMVRGTIMLLSSGGNELVVEAVQNSPGTVNHDAKYKWGEGITGRVVQSGESAIIPRVSKEPLFRDRIHGRRLAGGEDVSFICVPIKIGLDVVGTLSVDLPVESKENLLDSERLLSIVSGMIAHDVNSRRTARLEHETLEAENLRLRGALGEQFKPENIIGNSKIMQEVFLRIHQVAQNDTTVLIRGESGTGKELVASALHYGSPRRNGPFVKVNCSALSEHLIESELFGHERGAFTGAINTRIGRFEEASGGTLFLDEIGDIPQWVQVRLLRVLQERCFERVGSNKSITTDVRIIVATNRDLEKAVESGLFRKDLYYRINVFPIFLPSLRERKEDLLLLANYFCRKYSKKTGKDIRRISTPAINMFMAYHWPGNVRELENCMEHAVVMCNDGVIHGYDLPPTLQTPDSEEISNSGLLKLRVRILETELITDALKHTGGNILATARELGCSSRVLRYKMGDLKIVFSEFRKSPDNCPFSKPLNVNTDSITR